MWFADQRLRDISRCLETLGHTVESAVGVYVRHDPAGPVTYRWLHSIAQLRFALALCADLLSTYVADTPEELQLTHRGSNMMEEFVDFLSSRLLRDNLQDLSMYLAKHITRRHGMQILRCLYNQGLQFVLPVALHQQVRFIKRLSLETTSAYSCTLSYMYYLNHGALVHMHFLGARPKAKKFVYT